MHRSKLDFYTFLYFSPSQNSLFFLPFSTSSIECYPTQRQTTSLPPSTIFNYFSPSQNSITTFSTPIITTSDLPTQHQTTFSISTLFYLLFSQSKLTPSPLPPIFYLFLHNSTLFSSFFTLPAPAYIFTYYTPIPTFYCKRPSCRCGRESPLKN